jgi:hypothetical protein
MRDVQENKERENGNTVNSEKTKTTNQRQTHIHSRTDEQTINMSIPWGDLPCMKSDDSCRIIMQNVNGLSASYNTKSIALAAEADAISADIIGLIETNTYWKFGDVLSTTKKSWQKFFDQTKIEVSSSNIHFDSPYQPGGTMTVVGSPWASRTKTASDNTGLGRWTESEITGKNGRAVVILTG